MELGAWKTNLIVLFISQTCVMIAFSFVFPFIPLYVRDLGVTDNAAAAYWAGAIGAAAAITMAITQPFWGSLADRHGRRIMVLRSIGAASITLVLMGLVQHPWQLLVLRFLQGAFTGTVAASNALVASSVPRERLGSSLGFMQVALYGGTSLGPLIGGFISDRLGYRVACFAAGGLMLFSLLLVVLFVRETFIPPPADVRQPGIFANNRRLLAVPGMLLVLSILFLIQYGNSVVSPILALFIHEISNGKNAASTAGAILAGTGIASAFAAVLAGRLGDRIGHRRLLPVCLLGAALTCLPQAFVHTPGQLFALRLALGLFLGGLMPSANALLAGLVPSNDRGSAFGLGAAAIALASALGPLSGAITGGTLGMRSVFLATAFLYVVGLAFVLSRLRELPSPRKDASLALVARDPIE
jgi:DHA1 family multidrug resistance protein-like MFS transporter